MTFILFVILLCSPMQVNCECETGVRRCEWESWGYWSSCSRTCAGLRTRRRNMCCGIHVPDCIDKCHRANTSVETEACETHCPNGGTYMDGICQCPPLRKGICCEGTEANSSDDCSRHCTWVNWQSWSSCSTLCGCGKRTRERKPCCLRSLNYTACLEDCDMFEDNDQRTCTAVCASYTTPCKLCTWNTWQSWTSCSQECGGGKRSRSRMPCCCSGQTDVEGCLFDCGLPLSDIQEREPCGEICHNHGSFVNGNCTCPEGFSGPCCQDEIMKSNSTKFGTAVDGGMHTKGYILVGAGSAVGAVIITSLIWYLCQRRKNKRNSSDNVYDTPTRTVSNTGTIAESFESHRANPSYEGNTGLSEEAYYDKLH